jgi:lipopolysaccharide biosynthesis regulator YciM
MGEILFLLLPFAFYSGWKAARNKFYNKQKQQNQLSGHFVKGVNYLLNEEPDKALEVFLNYPEIDESTAETYQLLGNLFRNRGEVDRALRVHQNLIARSNINNHQKQKAMFSLGQDFFSAGMLDRAESVFHELLNNSKLDKQLSKSSICTSLRTIYEQTQEWEKAIEAINCFKKHDKKNEDSTTNSNALVAHYYCELADEYLNKGNLHEVDKLMAKAKNAHKQSPRLLCLQGDIAFHQEKYKNALNKYLQAIKHDSRLLSMLFDKVETSANKIHDMHSLQSSLLKLYKTQRDRSIFEKILIISQKYKLVSKVLDELIIEELSSQKLNIESIYHASEYIIGKQGSIKSEEGLNLVKKSLESYLKGVPAFRCVHCGYKMHDFLWRCPACHHWDTIEHA